MRCLLLTISFVLFSLKSSTAAYFPCDLSKIEKKSKLMLVGENHNSKRSTELVTKHLYMKALHGKIYLINEGTTKRTAAHYAEFPDAKEFALEDTYYKFMTRIFWTYLMTDIYVVTPNDANRANFLREMKTFFSEIQYYVGETVDLDKDVFQSMDLLKDKYPAEYPALGSQIQRIREFIKKGFAEPKVLTPALIQEASLENERRVQEMIDSKEFKDPTTTLNFVQIFGVGYAFAGQLLSEKDPKKYPDVSKAVDFFKIPKAEKIDEFIQRFSIDVRNEISSRNIGAIYCKALEDNNPIWAHFGGAHLKGIKANLEPELERWKIPYEAISLHDLQDDSPIYKVLEDFLDAL